MLILALDTCLGACSAAVVRGEQTLAAISEPMSRGHQERLAPMVREVMAEVQAPFAAVDRIGVTVGPGSFTGLRVGLAFAKGLGLALGRPVVGVGVLHALAKAAAPQGPAAAAIDAGRGRVYLQLFESAEPVGAPEVLDLDEALAKLVQSFPAGEFTLCGPGAAMLSPTWPAAQVVQAEAPDPVVVAHLAAAGPPGPATPLYLRPPDAIPKAQRRV
ncbi:MAG: tRNA (adenosine(37)-N6)-threonylcarbamoyltransferase complex dimerization subunit type 1 TsaB [Caulobacteraceae bacterium]|nr:tRNA (adenosine(37)-N6)-threonylcarbamoyltransferase complex dimerization subunit type 1 TsaB [Caulobacteraceae bacterium]